MCGDYGVHFTGRDCGGNLASMCLPSFVEGDTFNFEKLGKYTQIVCKNLNKIIDKNFYPVEKARRSNLRHRPIGIGVQGLTDTYMMLRMPYESDEAPELNRRIFLKRFTTTRCICRWIFLVSERR